MSTLRNKKLEPGYVIYERLGSYGIIHTSNIPSGQGIIIVSDVAKSPLDLTDELNSLRERNKF